MDRPYLGKQLPIYIVLDHLHPTSKNKDYRDEITNVIFIGTSLDDAVNAKNYLERFNYSNDLWQSKPMTIVKTTTGIFYEDGLENEDDVTHLNPRKRNAGEDDHDLVVKMARFAISPDTRRVSP